VQVAGRHSIGGARLRLVGVGCPVPGTRSGSRATNAHGLSASPPHTYMLRPLHYVTLRSGSHPSLQFRTTPETIDQSPCSRPAAVLLRAEVRAPEFVSLEGLPDCVKPAHPVQTGPSWSCLQRGLWDPDLFVACRAAGGWELPSQLPEPVNSRFAEFAAGLSREYLYFASERACVVAVVPDSVRPPGEGCARNRRRDVWPCDPSMSPWRNRVTTGRPRRRVRMSDGCASRRRARCDGSLVRALRDLRPRNHRGRS